MKIYTRAGRLSFLEMTFPDGQPHFELLRGDEFRDCTIEAPIRNADELLRILLAKDALTTSGYTVALDVRYLLGARMDRAIDRQQPFTLAVVARVLNQAGFKRIRVFDPHSPMSASLLSADTVLPIPQVQAAIEAQPSDVLIVAPDAGATPRVNAILTALGLDERYRVVQCYKDRDSQTGRLSGFRVGDPGIVRGRACLIVDDLCDGGGTFIGLAKELRAAGARSVDLYVTHGIFSKGIALAGIDRIFTTDSYFNWSDGKGFVVLPAEMDKTETLTLSG